MAEICRKIQERIEEVRNETREQCDNVSRTVSETICTWLPWPLDDLCDVVTRVIVELVCYLVVVVITIVSWVTRVVCEVVMIVAFIITHLIGFLEWLAGRILSVPELIGCLIGINTGKKHLRICALVIADEKDQPVVDLNIIQEQINKATEIYRQCHVEVSAIDINVVTGRQHLLNASGCDAGGYFSTDRVEYEQLSCNKGFFTRMKSLRFPSGLIWPRHILKAIWVRDIQNGKRGCYLLPESFVLIAESAAIDTLAHELGHACDLLHRDDTNNLMATPTRTDTQLTSSQCCTIRTSRFVTIL